MKNIIIALLLSLIANNIFSQLPKGDRILAWQVDMTENQNYDSAYTYALDGCMESVHVFFPWSAIEPSNGNFSQSYISNVLDITNIYHPAFNIKAELQIAPVNTVAKETPSDLINTSFDDPIMIDRFKILLDTLFAHIPDIELNALNIGNESDVYFGTDELKYSQYKTFLNAVIPYAKQLYFDLHSTELKVGTTLTLDGLTSESQATLCQTLNENLDVTSVTYYPLNSDFTMESPSVVMDDFSDLVNIYSVIEQPIYFVECGYSSSTICESSEELQSQFYQNVFTAWDEFYDNIKLLTIFKSTDWSQSEVDDFAIYYGISDIVFLEYLRTLGVRSWEGNGENKMAFESILCELESREWCEASCITDDIMEHDPIYEINIYPNPSSDFIALNTKQKIKSIAVYNYSGVLIMTYNENEILINNLATGLYYLNVEFNDGQSGWSRFIKR